MQAPSPCPLPMGRKGRRRRRRRRRKRANPRENPHQDPLPASGQNRDGPPVLIPEPELAAPPAAPLQHPNRLSARFDWNGHPASGTYQVQLALRSDCAGVSAPAGDGCDHNVVVLQGRDELLRPRTAAAGRRLGSRRHSFRWRNDPNSPVGYTIKINASSRSIADRAPTFAMGGDGRRWAAAAGGGRRRRAAGGGGRQRWRTGREQSRFASLPIWPSLPCPQQ